MNAKRFCLKDLRKSGNRVQRCTQLMADMGKELGFCLICLLSELQIFRQLLACILMIGNVFGYTEEELWNAILVAHGHFAGVKQASANILRLNRLDRDIQNLV